MYVVFNLSKYSKCNGTVLCMSCISCPVRFIINVWLIVVHKQRLRGSGGVVEGFVLQQN